MVVVTNIRAYHGGVLITAVKSFMTEAQGHKGSELLFSFLNKCYNFTPILYFQATLELTRVEPLMRLVMVGS
jgi:hypothetical protein